MSKEEENKGSDNPTTEITADAFGETAPEPTTPPATDGDKGEGKEGGDKGKEGTPEVSIPEDHPTVVALKNQIEDIKKEYGGNLSGQREVIDRLNDEIKAMKDGGSTEGEEKPALFDDIKWSKDLTKEEKEEMTDTEIKQMDEIARMQEAQNKMYADQQSQAQQAESQKVDDLQQTVKSISKELATGEDGQVDTNLANQIIESSKQFNLEGLDQATLRSRIETARTLLPNYEAPKEQPKAPDAPPVKTDEAPKDAFDTDAIIEEATSGQEGNYTL